MPVRTVSMLTPIFSAFTWRVAKPSRISSVFSKRAPIAEPRATTAATAAPPTTPAIAAAEVEAPPRPLTRLVMPLAADPVAPGSICKPWNNRLIALLAPCPPPETLCDACANWSSPLAAPSALPEMPPKASPASLALDASLSKSPSADEAAAPTLSISPAADDAWPPALLIEEAALLLASSIFCAFSAYLSDLSIILSRASSALRMFFCNLRASSLSGPLRLDTRSYFSRKESRSFCCTSICALRLSHCLTSFSMSPADTWLTLSATLDMVSDILSADSSTPLNALLVSPENAWTAFKILLSAFSIFELLISVSNRILPSDIDFCPLSM